MEPIFKTSIIGFKIVVFPDRLVYTKLFLIEKSIDINRIASVELGMPLLQQVILETSGGEKIKLLVRLRDKKNLRDAIFQAKNKS